MAFTSGYSFKAGEDIGTDTLPKKLNRMISGMVVSTSTPATAAATGTTGTFAYDASYLYICTATNTWKRAAIATW